MGLEFIPRVRVEVSGVDKITEEESHKGRRGQRIKAQWKFLQLGAEGSGQS